jgi:membrane-bound lytic murein transglycosylase F
MRFFSKLQLFLLSLVIILSSCEEQDIPLDIKPTSAADSVTTIDFNEIVKNDTLKAITIYGPSSYFLYRGQAMGFEYEILEGLAKKLNLHLKIIVSKNIDELFSKLNSGDGDLVVYGLTITNARKKIVDFTIPYTSSYQVLVQRYPTDWKSLSYKDKQNAILRDVTQLGGKTISIRENSSYYERIKHLSAEIGDSIGIEVVSGELSTFDIIQKVAEGEYDYTLADNNIAQLNKSYFPNIDVSVVASLSQNIAWSIRKNSPELKDTLNSLLRTYIGSAQFNIIYDKYFGSSKQFKKRVTSEYYSLKTGKISPYDELIKKYSNGINWDWRLLCSVIYQESHFDPNAGSWAGAHGLMQLMPATAKKMGVINKSNPEQSIAGGSKYLKLLYNRWESIPDTTERIKFTLASYNCGYGHVVDAQKLAINDGKTGLRWDNNVDEYILKLAKKEFYTKKEISYGYTRGAEPYNYVKNIFARYYDYKEILGR